MDNKFVKLIQLQNLSRESLEYQTNWRFQKFYIAWRNNILYLKAAENKQDIKIWAENTRK